MSAPVKEGDVLGGKFRVERVLGTGGMGVIVAAYHLQLDQHVALKFLLPDAAKEEAVVQRFAREARAAAKIQSEHVARVLDVGTLDTGAPYMVMEYLEGKDLDQILKASGPLSVHDTVGYVMQACEAIAEAHALGIVHRDLKPANLFVADRADGKKSLKVLDFGISKVLPGAQQQAEPSLTNTSAIMGSPMYMSPEQLRSSKDVDVRADIWALGVVLYECLAGAGPFASGTVAEVCAAILKDKPRSLREARPEVPEGLDLVVARCLEKDVDRRYTNVAELTVALLSFGPPGCEVSIERVSSVLRNIGLAQRSGPATRRDPPPPGEPTRPEIPKAKDGTPTDAASERAALELAATKASHSAGVAAPGVTAEGMRPTEPGTPMSIARSDPSATASAVSRSSWNAAPARPNGRGWLFAVAAALLMSGAGAAFLFFFRPWLHGAASPAAAESSGAAFVEAPSAAALPALPTSVEAPAAATASEAATVEEAPEPSVETPDPHKQRWAPSHYASAPPSSTPSAPAAPSSDASAAPKSGPAPSSSAKAGPLASASLKAGGALPAAKAAPKASANPAASAPSK